MSTNKIDIHVAAGQGNMGEVKAFLKAGGIIDKRDADRWTPLMLACREGHIEVARQFLRSGAALEARDGDKWTAMHVASANGHPQCCQLLLDRGGNPRAVDENKRTPLHWATRYLSTFEFMMTMNVFLCTYVEERYAIGTCWGTFSRCINWYISPKREI